MLLKQLSSLLHSSPASPEFLTFLSRLQSRSTPGQNGQPDVKVYSDSAYFNYHILGMSLRFIYQDGYIPGSVKMLDSSTGEHLELDSINIYNAATLATRPGMATAQFASFPDLPVSFSESWSASEFRISVSTTAKEFVAALGEPDRKGGGNGPSSGSIDIWCEWTKLGIMIEFGGDNARGPLAWDEGKDALWKVMTVFK